MHRDRTRTLASRSALLALAAASAGLAPHALAGTQYWDPNGSASGLGGTGTWDTSLPNWNDSTGTGAPAVWVNGNDAVFAGTASGTATPVIVGAGGVTANSVAFANAAGNYKIDGPGTITITNPAASFVMQTNSGGSPRAQIVTAPIAGSDITVVANQPTSGTVTTSFLTLGVNTATPTAANQNLFTGNLVFAGAGAPTTLSQININNALALPSTATAMMQRDLSQLLFTAGGASGSTAYAATFNNNIKLNTAGSGWFTSGIGSASAGSLITLGGVISGNADLTIKVGASGGQGTIILANQNTYAGNTFIATAAGTATSLKLATNNGLPQTTTLSMGASTAQGNFDLAGFNQTVAGLTSNGAGQAILLNSVPGNLSTFTINGNATTTYSGTVGGTGTSNHLALALAAGNTGTLTLNGANTYDGGTTVNGGTLLTNSATAVGTGPVIVGASGRFGGTATVAGALTSAGTLVPGSANAAGTLTLNGAASLAAGSSADFEFSPTANDKIAAGGTLTLPASAHSLNLNFIDLGSAFKNQTYTLISGAGVPVGIDTSAAGPLKVASTPTSGAARNATFTLSQDAATNAVLLTVSGVGDYLTWKGDAASGGGSVDTTTPNWDNAGTVATYAEPDDLTFNDTANGTGNVTLNLPANINPGRLTFNTVARNYTLAGPGSIVGNASLVKTGTGTLTLSAVDNSTGPIALRGGIIVVDTSFNAGAAPLSFEGGTLAPSVSVSTGRAVGVTGSGTLSIAAGADSTLSGPITGTGSLIKTNTGGLTLAGTLNVGTLTLNGGTTTLTATGGGRLGALAIASTASGTITPAKLDIGSATLAVSNGTTTNIVRGFLANARNTTGNWDGASGLLSSLAANDPNKIVGVGYYTAADIGATSLNGVALAPSDLVLRATYYGDTNNDGKVTADDLAVVDRAFAKGLPATWTNGDFNYDGKIDSNDYLLMDKAFGLQSGGFSPDFLAQRQQQFGVDYVSALIASVPEPSSLAACGFALLPLIRRRRR